VYEAWIRSITEAPVLSCLLQTVRNEKANYHIQKSNAVEAQVAARQQELRAWREGNRPIADVPRVLKVSTSPLLLPLPYSYTMLCTSHQ
jgi:hypothetical protein